MLEFFDESTQWSRGLWHAGTVLIGRELVEAGDPVMSASERALKTLQGELLDRVVLDPAACHPSKRSSTKKMLATPVSSLVRPGHTWHVLSAWVESTRLNYLKDWSNALTSQIGLPSAECTARLLAAHLLDEGFSRKHLHRWITYRVKHSQDVHTLADMCSDLHAKVIVGPQPIEVLVPLAAHAALPRPAPVGWLTPLQVRNWRTAKIPQGAAIRQHGGLLLELDALDIYEAAELARARITTIRDRFRVGGRREVRFSTEMWIAGVEAALPTEAPPRRVEVYAFERQAALWSHSVRPDLEAAMELMAPLERGPSPAAVIGAWAAVESLLIGPGDEAKHLASDRLALILAGGHLRAELTKLAWAHANATTDRLAVQVKSLDTNQLRAQRVLAHVIDGGQLSLPRPQDQHSLERVRDGLQDTYSYVDRVRRAIEPALRGLYRQRNLLSHAGGTAGVAIRPTLDRAAPLVAAGMDRIVHVALTGGQSALELAALARVRHEALRGQPSSSALSLLEV